MLALFTFYALPSGGKSKDAVVHWFNASLHLLLADELPVLTLWVIPAFFRVFLFDQWNLLQQIIEIIERVISLNQKSPAITTRTWPPPK